MTNPNRSEPDTAHMLDEIVRATSEEGVGPNRAGRREANVYYSDEQGRFGGSGLYRSNAGTDNHLLEMIDGRAHLTMLGLMVLIERQDMLDVPTPFFAKLQISDGHKHLTPFSAVVLEGLAGRSVLVRAYLAKRNTNAA